MSDFNNKYGGWLGGIARSMRQEFKLVLRDEAVIIFFVVLAVVYPPLYSLIYNTEVTRDVSIVVVDDNRSALSREFTRKLDATPDVKVVSYCKNMDEARRLMAEKKTYAVVYFPSDFDISVARGQQGHVSLYCDMSVMMRYKAALTALTNVQMEMCTELQGQKSAHIIDLGGGIVESRQVPLGNTGMGIASAVLPFILVYVLQQGMIMGIAMLHAGSMGRRRRNRGVDRLTEDALPASMLLGKVLAHLTIYVLPTLFALYFVPLIFRFPMNGNFLQVLLMVLPFLIATSLLGNVLRVLVKNREGVFLIIAFTSVIFVFLTGVSWPAYEMAPHWQAIRMLIPGYWAANAYVHMEVGGATLGQMSTSYIALWVLAAIYFVMAYLIELLVLRPRYKAMQLECEIDREALRKRELYEQGDDELDGAELLDDEEEDE